MSKPLCIIVGYGAGVGQGIALAFGKAGFRLGLIARNPTKLAEPLRQLTDAGIEAVLKAADAGDENALTSAISAISADEGADVLVYNAVSATLGKPSTLSASQLVNDFRVDVVGALVAAQTVLPSMRSRRIGCILFTGGGWAHYPWDQVASIGIGKSGLRSLALTFAQELADSGVRVGLISIMGQVAPGTQFDPGSIGQAFLKVYERPPSEHEPELLFKG
jgi:NADP-dependent 3-hydroxy acid dehydrogenase YdfG